MQDLLIIEETGTLFTCAEDKKINIWDYQAGKLEETIQKGDYFKTLDYINSLKMLFGGNMDKNVYSIQISKYIDKDKNKAEDAKTAEENKALEEEIDEDEKSPEFRERENKNNEELYELLKMQTNE